MESISLRIFASHPVVNRHYANLLSSQRDFCIAANDAPFLVGVFDGELASLDAAFTLFRARFSAMRPLLLSTYCREDECLRWLLRGMWGLVSYDRYEADLPRAIRQIAEGQLWFPPSVVARWMQVSASERTSALRLPLTDREQQVMEFLLRRFTNKEIAEILKISERTVKFHVANILNKLHVGSRSELVSMWAPELSPAY